ncbi:regulator of nonsense transcription [Cadophora gregata]|uniref:regulator of nonsense transcription n=1 Tax=Cadophora gregata TaxID=51156 RepID=UPI0026DD66EB|nr:regulator of nonsense transcription [Cadophora gregata]KAK0119986.1 regulator of nonsense transcription [Cadophora gregata]KAK0121022.1 regulator of nonsense transcription [Cadophora gregata f. sp. sojae]
MATRTQANGVLSIASSQTTGNGNKPAPAKPAAVKLKIIIRRLPPGLTQEEFTTILGEEWKLGQGKVDWFRYKPGKDSKDASKPSKPSRAYLHLTNESYLLSLSDAVRLAVFEDATNTYNSLCLIGPPSVEFAPYGRIPAGRRRVDARAGTIDQDPEFMAFLEDLANPTTGKEINADSLLDPSPSKHEKVTMTPLVQALKDKKASKNKDAAVKAAKKQEVNSSKGKSAKESAAEEKKKGKDAKTDRLVDKATKEAVKILNREAASKSVAGSSATSEASGSESSATPKLDLGKVPGRQRQAIVAAHIRMLQRDLGLSPAQAHRQVRRDNADAQKAERAAAAAAATAEKGKDNGDSTPARSLQAQPVPTAPKSTLNQNSNRKGRGKGSSTESEGTKSTTANNPPTPMVLLKKPDAQSTAASSSSSQPAKVATAPPAARRPQQIATPSEGATQAFVKHANPSQGVTEALLKEAMEKFGTVTTVEIDRRKGFAYVDFADTDGLKKAMGANPISVAQGTVQVMQRKGTALPPEKKAINQIPNAPARAGRGGRGGNGSGTVGRRGGRGGARGGAGSSESMKTPPAPTGPSK